VHEDPIPALLQEIRDLQKASLAEYRHVTQQSLEMQQRAVSRQEETARLYRRVVLVAAALSIPLLALLLYLLSRFGDRLFS
jgi:hypothetical protein